MAKSLFDMIRMKTSVYNLLFKNKIMECGPNKSHNSHFKLWTVFYNLYWKYNVYKSPQETIL